MPQMPEHQAEPRTQDAPQRGDSPMGTWGESVFIFGILPSQMYFEHLLCAWTCGRHGQLVMTKACFSCVF